MGIFNFFQKKAQPQEIIMRKPRRASAPKKFTYKVECVVMYKDKSIGRFTFTANAFTRAMMERDLKNGVHIKIGKPSRV